MRPSSPVLKKKLFRAVNRLQAIESDSYFVLFLLTVMEVLTTMTMIPIKNG